MARTKHTDPRERPLFDLAQAQRLCAQIEGGSAYRNARLASIALLAQSGAELRALQRESPMTFADLRAAVEAFRHQAEGLLELAAEAEARLEAAALPGGRIQ